MRKIHLQPAFGGLRARSEYFQDQRRAVEHFNIPGPFEIAVLNRRQGAVDNDQTGPRLIRVEMRADLRNLAAAHQSRWFRLRNRDHFCCDDIQINRGGQPRRLFQPRFRRSYALIPFEGGMNDNGGFLLGQVRPLFVFVIAVPQGYRLLRHHRGNRMFVNQLRVTVAF